MEDQFVNFVHTMAQEIATRADTGLSLKEQVLVAANDDMRGFCSRFINYYDGEFDGKRLRHAAQMPVAIEVIARLLAYGMIRQHEFDTGNAETFGESWAKAAAEHEEAVQ